jgi:two-component system phosphate regulon sensor histidine kinase PhoR
VPLLLALVGGLLAGFALNQVLERAISGRAEASAFALLARTGPDVQAALASGGDPTGTIERLGRQLSLRATLVSGDGRVLADSGVERSRVAALESHANRPEIREALASGRGVDTRFSSTLGTRLVYAAIRLEGGAVLRVAFPERELAAWEKPYRRQTLAISLLAGLLVAVLFTWLRHRHAGELRVVRGRVAAVSRGERPATPGPVSEEAAAVLADLGDLAELLETRDAGARRRAEVARTVFERVPAGLLVVDPRLSLLEANGEALRLLAVPPSEARPGAHLLEVVRERAVAAFVESALAGGEARATLSLPAERGGLTLAAEAVRLPGTASPGEPAAVVFLREPRPDAAG